MKILSSPEERYTVGGKAGSLFMLQRHGFSVPPFVVIPAEEFGRLLQEDDPLSAISAFDFPEEAINNILRMLPSATHFSVRSSCEGEDGVAFSYAGQFESFLYVTPENIANRIRDVWRSALSSRVAEYNAHNGIAAAARMAVIIQVMIDADVSGVAFSINPVSGSRREKIISAVWGAGEGLVSGVLDADTYTVFSNGKTDAVIAKKEHMYAISRDGQGTAKTPVSPAKINAPCLDQEKLIQIAAALNKLYELTGTYQDVEFCFRSGALFILQARPLTTAHRLADGSGDHIIWDNSNIIESYPGVTTPLTFSFIIRMYEAVYRQMCDIMGVSRQDIDKNSEVFANMLGIINGRVYYNLLSWYKALALLPGFSLNASFMEKMMGVKERFELTDIQKRSRFSERLRVLRMVSVMIRNFRSLGNMRRDFRNDFNAVMKEFDAIDLQSQSPEELMRLYKRFERTLLTRWKAPVVNDFFAMIFFGMIQKLSGKYGLPPGIHNDLLAGAKDIVSTEPVRLSLALSGQIQAHSAAAKLFRTSSPETIWRELPGCAPEIYMRFREYIDLYGARCVGELKLETITYKQDPASFVKIIKGYVEQGIGADSFIHDDRMRKDAEAQVEAHLAKKPLKRFLFRYVLKRARVLVSERENLRFERTRGFNKVREIFSAIGNRFYADGIIGSGRDIFYLTSPEIFDFIGGTAVTQDLRGLIAMRKKEYAKHAEKQTGERITTKGVVYQGNDFYSKAEAVLTGDLKGLGACPGRIRARVQVVNDPREVNSLNGDILVTSSTDPGWVTLFPGASGILVERGSLLSHSAIVSREMGKPCIVGISGLLSRLKTGDEVEMDGSTGDVKIISDNSNANG